MIRQTSHEKISILQSRFFQKNAPKIAPKLLGKVLIRKFKNGQTKQVMITEVEAYDGFKDKASHAHRGKTQRNQIMFGKGGYWYVYFVYGIHWMLNIVTGKKNYASAVLIRGGLELKNGKVLKGPAELTKYLKIDKKFNEKLAITKNKLFIVDYKLCIKSKNINRLPRIGVNYAGKYWAGRRWRYNLVLPESLILDP